MLRRRVFAAFLVSECFFYAGTTPAFSADIGTAFTYQGYLEKPAGTPVNDTCDFRFSLFDVPAGGSQIGTQTVTGVSVSGGAFTTSMNFGPAAINGTQRWLDISVQCPGDGGFVLLAPRVELKPAPHALALPGLYTQQNATSPNIIGGFSGNSAAVGGVGGTIGGGGTSGLPNTVGVYFDTVGGGVGNIATDQYSTVAGGYGNDATGYVSTVGGGQDNYATGRFSTVAGGLVNSAAGDFSTVGGGDHNNAVGAYATIAGGGPSDPGVQSTNNYVGQDYGTIGGGGHNRVGDFQGGVYATIGGGYFNSAARAYCTVGGGSNNAATGTNAAISGGAGNIASANGSSVSGGSGNVASGDNSAVSGGFQNGASALRSYVGGGELNFASGDYSVVPGGFGNTAGGLFSLAAGFSAGVRTPAQAGNGSGDAGTFMWSDSSTFAPFTSDGSFRFLVRAAGGTRFYSNSFLTSGVSLAAGGGSWSSISDRNLKENFQAVDGREVLEKVAAMPILSWNYISQDDSIRHMGPMGQDFHQPFGLGDEPPRINTVDVDGVALAAIQGLHGMLQNKDCEIGELKDENAGLREQNAQLDARLVALEAMVQQLNKAMQGGGQ